MAKYNQHYAILRSIKRCFSRSPTHREKLTEAKCPRKKGPRGGARYRCAVCRKDFSLSSVNVDHIDPIVPVGVPSKDMSWDEIVSRTFCSSDNLQVLCKTCHDKKSKGERDARKRAKDKLSRESTEDSKRLPSICSESGPESRPHQTDCNCSKRGGEGCPKTSTKGTK